MVTHYKEKQYDIFYLCGKSSYPDLNLMFNTSASLCWFSRVIHFNLVAVCFLVLGKKREVPFTECLLRDKCLLCI